MEFEPSLPKSSIEQLADLREKAVQARLAWYVAGLAAKKYFWEKESPATNRFIESVELYGKEDPRSLEARAGHHLAKADQRELQAQEKAAADVMNQIEDELELVANNSGEHGGTELGGVAKEARRRFAALISPEDTVGKEMLKNVSFEEEWEELGVSDNSRQ